MRYIVVVLAMTAAGMSRSTRTTLPLSRSSDRNVANIVLHAACQRGGESPLTLQCSPHKDKPA